MNSLDRFNNGGFSLWWTKRCLQALFCAWVVIALLGFILHSKSFSQLSNVLSEIFVYVVVLTTVVQGLIWLSRPRQ